MIEGIPVVALGPIGVIVLALVLPYIQIARGKLRPESAVKDEREDTERWRKAHETSEEARRIGEESRKVFADQFTELLEHARTTDALIRSLVNRAEDTR